VKLKAQLTEQQIPKYHTHGENAKCHTSTEKIPLLCKLKYTHVTERVFANIYTQFHQKFL